MMQRMWLIGNDCETSPPDNYGNYLNFWISGVFARGFTISLNSKAGCRSTQIIRSCARDPRENGENNKNTFGTP